MGGSCKEQVVNAGQFFFLLLQHVQLNRADCLELSDIAGPTAFHAT